MAQRSYGCPIPGQIGQDLEKPGLAESAPACGRVWNKMVFMVPANPNHSRSLHIKGAKIQASGAQLFTTGVSSGDFLSNLLGIIMQGKAVP